MADLLLSKSFMFMAVCSNRHDRTKRRRSPFYKDQCFRQRLYNGNVLTDGFSNDPLELVIDRRKTSRKRHRYWANEDSPGKRLKASESSDLICLETRRRKYARLELLRLRFSHKPDPMIRSTCKEVNRELGIHLESNKMEKIHFVNRKTNKVIHVDRSWYLKVISRSNHLHVEGSVSSADPDPIHVNYRSFQRHSLVSAGQLHKRGPNHDEQQQRNGLNHEEKLSSIFNQEEFQVWLQQIGESWSLDGLKV